MKKLWFIVLVVILGVFISIGAFASVPKSLTAEVVNYQIFMNGEKKNFNQPVTNINGVTYVPLRDVGENLGLDVKWEESEKKITLTSKQTASDDVKTDTVTSSVATSTNTSVQKTLTAEVVNYQIFINGEKKTFNQPVTNINGSAYVPLREVAENLGLDVKWGEYEQKITLTTKQTNNDDVLLPFRKDGIYGYMDKNGNVIIKPKFWYADEFSEGLARAMTTYGPGSGYFNTKGEVAIPFNGNLWGYSDFKNGTAIVQLHDDTYTYIDKTGKQLSNKTYDDAKSFSEGYAPVEIDGKWGLIDNKFNMVLDCQYEDLGEVCDGFIAARKQGKSGLINTKGEVVVDFKYDSIETFSEGLVCACINGKCGYINKKGEVAVDFKYNQIGGAFSENLAAVHVDYGLGFINTKGEVVIPGQFKDVFGDFSEGVAVVQSYNGLWGAINNKGEYVIDPKYGFLEDCKNGLMVAEDKGKMPCYGDIFYITKTGEEIKPKL